MLLSIIIPMYNVEQFIVECVDSVIDFPCKIYLINDGSTDRTLDIVSHKYGKKINVTIIDQSNIGLSRTRNRALELVNTKYVMFLDSDDIINSNCLSVLLDEAENNDLDMVLFSGVTFIKYKEQPIKYHVNYIRKDEKIPQSGTDLLSKMLMSNYFCSACMYLYNYEKFSENRFEDMVHEDNLFTLDLLSSPENKKSIAVSTVIYYRRTRGNSIMTVLPTIENIMAYKHIINILIKYKSEASQTIQKENISKLIAVLHSSLVRTIFSNTSINKMEKIRNWIQLFPLFALGKYNMKYIIKCLLPIVVTLSKRINNESRNNS